MSNTRRLFALGGALLLVATLVLCLVSVSKSGLDCGSVVSPKSEPGGSSDSFEQIYNNNDCKSAIKDQRGKAIPLGILGLMALVGGVLDWNRIGKSSADPPASEPPAAPPASEPKPGTA